MGRLLLIAVLFIASPALAAEPSGCDKFAWPLDGEQHLLAEAQLASLGVILDRDTVRAVRLELQSWGSARLPSAPEHEPKKTPSWAGSVQFGAAAAGLYKISLSEDAWIDVVQDAHRVKSVAFTGATDCAHIRKSVKFELGPRPFMVQVSDAPSASIAIAITPVE
jgi:hypothetical protein